MLEVTHISGNHVLQDFRVFLQNELTRRCRANPKYSMRAFAKLLKIESSELSKLLTGKRRVSQKMLRKLAVRLELSPQQVEMFSVELRERRKTTTAVTSAPVRTPSYEELSQDVFQSIAEWYHYAILELTYLVDFKPDSKWIAKRLGITVHEVESAVERLQRLEMLEISSDKAWTDLSGRVSNITGAFTTAAKKQLQRQILSQAMRAIDEVDFDYRDNTSITMAIDSELIPEAKERIRAFRRELCAFLQSSSKRDSVYQLGVALFPAALPDKNGEEK